MKHTFNAERRRQKAFDAEQQGRFEDSLNSAGDLTNADAIDAAAAANTAALNDVAVSAAPAAEGYLPGSSNAPSIVADAAAKAGATADNRTAAFATALGRLGGTTDQMLRNSIRTARNAQEVDRISSFRRGSMGVLDAEMQAAAQKGRTLKGLGSLMQQAGMAAISGGLGSGAAGAGAAAGGGTAGTAAGFGSAIGANGSSMFQRLLPLVR
ncbi:hypothetical protein LZ518_08455 [Sphingomonas sp. RB56-2]|uniref:Uncharacterized protein n=1 Tax=Sphingomonas brevis TaxID=2908206 RepID=A0ABT0S9S2_9SPHN|nr:hypothetical protein [Sphingomonas brevis]MCL6741160.1 hypothetical protein [Sphingomonas brevis]